MDRRLPKAITLPEGKTITLAEWGLTLKPGLSASEVMKQYRAMADQIYNPCEVANG